ANRATSAGLSEVIKRSTRALARANSASLSITIRVASITPSPRRRDRIRRGCRRTGSPARPPDTVAPPIVITLDVEYHPAALQDARPRIRGFHIFGVTPSRAPRD